MAGIQGNIIVSVTDNNVSVQEGNVSNISVTSTTSNIELVAGSTFFPYDQILRDLIPGSNGVLTLGNATNYWDSLYVEKIFTANDQIIYNGNLDVQNGSLTVNGSNNTLTGELTITGNTHLDGNLFIDRTVGGTITGPSNRIFSESLYPHITRTFTLGDSGNVWNSAHIGNIHGDLYHGTDSGADANVNPLRANAVTLNTTGILSRGNALIFDSAHTTSTSNEKIIISSGGTENDTVGKQLGIIIDEPNGTITIGDGADILNPANSVITQTGLTIDTSTGNATLRGQNYFSIQSGIYEGNGRGLVGLTGSQLAGNIDTDDVSEGTTNLYLNGSGSTDDLSEGGTNQYFTTARANSAIGAYTGSFTNVGDISGSGNVTAFNSLNATNGGVFAESGLSKFLDANVSGRFNVGGNINIQNGQIDATTVNATGNIEGAVLKGTSIAITGDSSITGNLNVTGNINSETVVDLLVEDRNITLQYGQAGTPSANSQIFVDRGSEANSYILWDENGDAWKFSNDGNVEYLIPTSTTDLAEGTNLYYTNARANAAFTDSLDNIATEISSTANITTTANVQGSYFVGNVDATTVTATGNIDTTANINAAGGTLTGVLTSNSNIELTNDNIFVGDINGAIQQEVRNESGVTIARGKAVYLTGVATGSTPHVALANAEVSSQMPALGVVKNNIANASVGEVVISGQLNIGTHGFTIGSQLYINGAGDLTETIPLGEGNLVQKIGKVVTAQQIIVQGAGRTNATPNLDEGNIFLGGTSGTTISVTPDTNFDTTGNAFSLSNTLTDVNSITSETASALKLRGQTGGIELDKTVDSTDSTIVDIDTDGYTITDATMPADFTEGTACPTLIISINATNGSNTATCNDIYGGGLAGFGLDVSALRGPGFNAGFFAGNKDLIMTPNDPTIGRANVEAALTTAGSTFAGVPANGVGNSGAGLYGQNKGWRVVNLSGSSLDFLPLNAYITDVTGNVVTFSEDWVGSTQTVSIGIAPVMVNSGNANIQLRYQTRTSTDYGANSEVAGFYGSGQQYNLPETLANTTFDVVGYGNTTSVTATTVNTKNIVDVESGNESATRFTRSLLIGPSTTPDPFSARSDTNESSALGVILENDGETFTGNNAPAAKFLINSYSGNLDDQTQLPTWCTVGGTGNISLDLPQVKAPQFSLKASRGAKSTANTDSYPLQAGDVIGKITWNLNQTTGQGFQGADLVNAPAGITVDVGDANIGPVANAYMHITTTPDPGTNLGYMRNNANNSVGANQQTNFTTKDGNVTIAAQTSGMITLAPTPDYGDSANATTWTRFPGSTHEYHTFLNASFGNISAKTGTIVEIQPKSGTTTGSGGLGYDSVGNATLRLTTHESNSVVKGFWDLEFDQSAQSLHLKKDGTEEVKFTQDQTVFSNIPVMPSYSNTSLPTSVAGGIIFVTNGNNKPAYGDGTNWYYYDDTQVT